MKQLSHIFLALALLVPAVTFADNCKNSCPTTNCTTKCDTGCNQSCCFNSCGTDVCNTKCENSNYCPSLILKRPTYDNTVIYYGQEYAHRYDMDQVYGGFMVAFEYQRSFNASKLAQGLFGGSTLNFAGSQVANPAANALLADNFGLSQNFQGSINLKPVIQDYNLHFDWFVGLDEWAKGLYFQFDMNFDHQKRELQADNGCSTVNTTSAVPFPAGYMSVSSSTATPIADIKTALGLQGTFGDKTAPTQFGRFDFCDRTESGLAGLSMNFGYDFVRCDNYFLGAFFRVVAPTGSRVKPCFVFDAVVGNGKGWEVGAGLSSRWEMWNNNDCQKLTAMLDGYATSVLKHHSLRTFDLASTNTALLPNYNCANSCNKVCSVSSPCDTNTCSFSDCTPANDDCGTGCNAANCLTRYSLLKQYNALGGGAYAYANNLITAADFTTRNVDVRTPVKGDMTVRLVYTHGGFDLGFGYNLFGMARERISGVSAPSTCLFTSTGTVFAVKGCQGAGYNSYLISDSVVVDPLNVTALPLINSASNANAYVGGCGASVGGCGTVDNPVVIPSTGTAFNVAYNSNANNSQITPEANVTVLAAAANFVAPEASAPLAVLTGDVNELDLCSGTAPRQLTHKGFISLDYTWVDNDWAPFLGFIAEVEGGSRNTDINQWGIVVRGGISY